MQHATVNPASAFTTILWIAMAAWCLTGCAPPLPPTASALTVPPAAVPPLVATPVAPAALPPAKLLNTPSTAAPPPKPEAAIVEVPSSLPDVPSSLPTSAQIRQQRIARYLAIGCAVDGVVVPLGQPLVALLGPVGAGVATADVLLVHPLVVRACALRHGTPIVEAIPSSR